MNHLLKRIRDKARAIPVTDEDLVWARIRAKEGVASISIVRTDAQCCGIFLVTKHKVHKYYVINRPTM